MRRVGKNGLESIWNKVPVDYYEVGIARNIGQKLWHECKFTAIKSLVSGMYPKKILDIGSNSGILTSKIAGLFPCAQIYGVDVYGKVVKYAQSKYLNIDFKIADAQSLPFKDKEFDLIFCLETLEHVESPLKALREIKRCLTSSGHAVISMDSGSFLFNIIWFFWTKIGGGKVWQDSHLYHFNKKKLKKMIISEGFVVDGEVISHFGMAITLRIKNK